MGLLLIWGLLASAHAAAQDLDVNRARQRYDQQRQVADQAEQNSNEHKRDYDRKKSDLDRALSDMQNARQRVRDLERDERDLDIEIAQLERTISNLASEIPALESERSGLQSQLDQARARRTNLQARQSKLNGDIADLNRRIAALEAETPPPEARIQKLKDQRAEKQTTLNEVNQNLTQNNQRINRLTNQISNLTQRINQKTSELRNARNLLPRKRSDLDRVRQQLRTARNDLQRAEDRHQDAEQVANRAWNDYQTAYNQWQSEEAIASDRWDYLQEVIRNYNAERDRILANARSTGSSDGSQEASTRFSNAGASEGEADGHREGTSEGTIDGKKREYVDGYTQGRAEASSNASLRTAYNAGIASGTAIANDKAHKEDYPVGFNDAYNAKIGTRPANDLTIDISDSLPSDPGGNGQDLTGANKRPGHVEAPAFGFPRTPAVDPPRSGNPNFSVPPNNGRFNRAPCGSLRLPEFESECRQLYNSHYSSAYNSRYSSIYVANYRSSFNTEADRAYRAALAATYATERKRGMEEGAQEQGVLDGFAARYPTAKIDEYAKGESDFAQQLQGAHLLVVRSVKFVDESGDGVSAPGEGAKIVLTVDNLGLEASPKEGTRFVVEGKSKLSTVNFEIRDLPAFPANTRVELVGVLAAKVATEFAKEKFSLSGRIERKTSSGYIPFHSVTAEGTTHFPLELDAVTIPKVNIGSTTTGQFTFKNLSNKTVAASKLALGSRDDEVEIVSEELELPELAPGESTTLDVEVKPSYWVGSTTAVKFKAQVDDEVSVRTTQSFLQNVEVNRDAAIKLMDRFGQLKTDPVFDVVAGSTVTFLVNMDFLATSRRQGPFTLEYWEKSHQSMRHGNGSTTRISYGSWSPGTNGSPSRMSWVIPQELKGQQAWVKIRMLDNRSISHALKVRFNVK
jgi:predicted  nucleic acid-binding Zn-ribbon protein